MITDLSGNIDLVSVENMSRLINEVMVTPTDLTPGYGSVYKRFKTPLPYDEVNEVIVPVKFEKSDNTVATLGADQLYLLSHKTSIMPLALKTERSSTIKRKSVIRKQVQQ